MTEVMSLGPDSSGPTRRRARSSARGRLRLGVIQVLVLTLFLTLFGRLWYLQVLGGET